MTARNDWTAHLVKYSIPQLRKRQRICEAQIAVAYKARNTEALIRLYTMQDSLTAAVMIKAGYMK
jgi:hypothetical protein